MTTKPTLLVLAAGLGSRYGSYKQIDKFGPSGETIMDYSIFDAVRAGFEKVVFVIGKSFEKDFIELAAKYNSKIKVEYVFQELHNVPKGVIVPADRQKPWGTGHAILVAAEKIHEPFAVINADDFYGKLSFESIAKYLSRQDMQDSEKYCMVGFILGNTLSEYGFVSRGVCDVDTKGKLSGITECTKIQKTDDSIVYTDENGQARHLTGKEIVSMNLWGFPPSIFAHLSKKFETFIKQNAGNPKSEFYIPFAVNELIEENIANVHVLTSNESWFGVTYKEDKPSVIERINQLVKAKTYPEKLW